MYIIYGFHFLKWVTKNIDLIHDIIIFLDVPVHIKKKVKFCELTEETLITEDVNCKSKSLIW